MAAVGATLRSIAAFVWSEAALVLVASLADSGGLLHPVEGDVQQHGADHTALRNAVLGALQLSLLDHARLQPLRDHPLAGNVPSMARMWSWASLSNADAKSASSAHCRFRALPFTT
jgi:hypothetical protein